MEPAFRHAKSRAFISSAELSMKQGAAGAPEGRSRFQKVSLVSRRLESSAGSARGRDGSPSRVSLLLQAWEREIVEKTGSSSPTQREHSPSLSLLKDFTAHGPIFSQVYAPAQRPRRQDERGKGGPGRDGSPSPAGAPREVPVHRESYVHGTLLPTRPAGAEKDSAQAEPTPVRASPGAGDGPGDPQTSQTSSPQWPSAGAAGQADPAGAGEGSVADVDGSLSATPPRTQSPPGAGSTPEKPPSEVGGGPEPSSETAASEKAEIELEGDETAGDPQGTAQEPESIPEPPTEPPAPHPPAESPPDAAEEDPELLVDMEILVDTLRNMEPSEMRKAEEEEIENPYLSPEERAAMGTLRGEPRDSAGGQAWVEGGSLLGTLGDEKAKLVAGGPAEQSGLFRGNVLKGMALLSHFLEQRAAGADEGKPYSRLDNSVLYSRFVSPSAALLELPDGDGAADSPCLRDHNGLGSGGHSGPEMAMLEALSSGSVPPITEEPESTVTLSLDRVLQEDKEGLEKINTRPGKIILYSDAGFAGQKREIWDDVPDATSWELSHTISIRVIRGGWVMYEKPRFRGRKCVLAEGDVEIDNPWAAYGDSKGDSEGDSGQRRGSRPFRIGSFKRVVRRAEPRTPLLPQDYRTPEISLFAQENGEGIILYSDAGFAGQKREIWDDVPDATSWELSHTISIRVIRGGWVMYEKPRFRGRKCVLAEGDVEIDNPWAAYGDSKGDSEGDSGQRRGSRPFRIGSFKRVVRDYRTPEISLFAQENGEGARLRFSGSAEDTRQRGQALAAASIIVHSGLWLLYSKPFFDDDPYVLEPGGYPSLKAWGAKDPSICSMHPIRLGCPVVERPGEPQVLIYEAAAFQGRSFPISRDIYDLKRLPEPALPTVGSLRVLGGCWVGYEKEGFRGHQYLLEEGEYQDWRHWGGYSEELVSLRLIRTDFSDPALVLFEAMDFEEGPSVELSEALPDTQLAGYGTVTQSIHVLSGVWVAYEGPNYSGEQYILEKGVYRSCEDWGATDCHIASAQPILQVREHNLHFVSKILLFSEPDFLGDHVAFEEDQEALPEAFTPRSCRVRGGSWILFDGQDFAGEQHVLSEGEYPTLGAMGCLCSTAIRSLKKVPLFFSEPSIFLHGLECFEGKEIELNSEVRSLQAEGFNNHVLSVRVKGGIWVLCEHGDFRGRQWLLDCTEITNWLTYSGLQHVGSLYPIRQRRIYFRVRSRKLELFLSVPDDVEDMKAGRVVVSSPSEQSSSVWYYEDGLIKNQVAPTMSLQVIGPAGKGAKAVLWSETRMPRQTWRVDSQGRIHSQMFEDMVLDVKGGRSYDRDHAVVWDVADERPTQIWDIQVL
ncbi:PREDICTED: absent in melanoma 1-like protein [Ficedula albicollis]|uniref:absent in melanoma 1-like protein n=1 Tax=Ficedula albicollis TaxID=59894 RepID=UPI0007AD80AD|nr:PREDICTED: absent in melanoma 1-like protein [Ficedula albicollis]